MIPESVQRNAGGMLSSSSKGGASWGTFGGPSRFYTLGCLDPLRPKELFQ